MGEALTLARLLTALATNEKARKTAGWIAAAILSPLILIAALLCSLGSGAATHNVSMVELCFRGGTIPESVPEEYRIYIEDMRKSLSQLDELITKVNGQMEDGTSLDETLVKAVFYALHFGAEAPSQQVRQEFLDCFVIYEEDKRLVPGVDEDGNEIEVEETYVTAAPVEDISALYQRLSETLGVVISDEQQNNIDSIRSLIEYGWTGGAEWGGELGGPVMSVTGFCSPLGEGWRSRITSDFGYRNCPYHGRELHSGLDMAAPSGTPIRAALAGTVTRSCFTSSYGNYTVIDHGNGLTTAYAHQSSRLVQVGQTVTAGEVIGLVGSTGNSTGPHLHLEVRLNGELKDPKLYLP